LSDRLSERTEGAKTKFNATEAIIENFCRPIVGRERSDLLAMAEDLFDVVLSGAVKIEINQSHPLKDAAEAHRDLESRKTVGSTVLTG